MLKLWGCCHFGIESDFINSSVGEALRWYFSFMSVVSCSFFFSFCSLFTQREKVIVNKQKQWNTLTFLLSFCKKGEGCLYLSSNSWFSIDVSIVLFSYGLENDLNESHRRNGLSRGLRGRPKAPMNLQLHYRCTVLGGRTHFLIARSLLSFIQPYVILKTPFHFFKKSC